MGSFLDKPETSKTTEVGDAEGLRWGFSAMQGWRIDMEDDHTMLTGLEHGDSFFGVYDGHGGALVSKEVAQHIWNHITSQDEWKSGDRTDASITEAIRKGFLVMDEQLKCHPRIVEGEDHSGSTAVTTLLTKEKIYCGNAGDSRSILVRDGKAVAMSEDHKPFNEGEQRRIEAAGGRVSMRRVNGDLAVSRALGDFLYKGADSLPAEQQMVSPEPEFIIQDRTAEDQFLVLACDGIWDVMNNQELADWLLNMVKQGCDDLGFLSEMLLDTCLERGSKDNMSVIIIELPGAPKPAPDAIARFKAARAEVEKEYGVGSNDKDAGAGSDKASEAGGSSESGPDGPFVGVVVQRRLEASSTGGGSA
jgi:serine/threonine protein phosphatase PrpC